MRAKASARAAILGLATSALWAPACGETAVALEHPNVVLIVVDSLRADRVGCYGYARPTTPNIDALAGAGYRFETAYATAPWTLPATASMLTGLDADLHGVRELGDRLPAGVPTLAERARAAGYATGAVVSDFLLGPARGFDAGFDSVSTAEARGEGHASSKGVAAAAAEFLERARRERRPFLLFAHFHDPHPGFLVHPETGFARDLPGGLKGGETLEFLRVMARDMQPAERLALDELYDGEVRAADEGVGRVVAELRRLGLERDALVVVTSNNGVELMDRGRIGDASGLLDELVRVPLVVKKPGGSGRVFDAPVSLASLTPTLCDLMGLAADAEAFSAPSLAGALRGTAPVPERPAYFMLDFEPVLASQSAGEGRLEGVATARFKLVRDMDSGAVQLFDLALDPGETEDAAAEHPAEVERLSRWLAGRRGAGPPAGP